MPILQVWEIGYVGRAWPTHNVQWQAYVQHFISLSGVTLVSNHTQMFCKLKNMQKIKGKLTLPITLLPSRKTVKTVTFNPTCASVENSNHAANCSTSLKI